MKRFKINILIIFALAAAAEACTIGLALGTATTDGRPIVFKNRDITAWNLEFRVDTPSGEHAYVRNSYRGSSTAWMGANEVGFAITQSAAYNVSGGGSGLSNGTMMNEALETCETVDDFEDILDATDGGGRSTTANYAVIDAYGNGAIFECSPYAHDRYDADTLGIVVRANFAYLGGSGRVGQNRMERAYQLMADAVRGDSLDAKFVSKYVVADLLYPDQDPYPLPWTGSFPSMPAGYVNTGDFTAVQTICNYNTRACGVVQGALTGGDPANILMWCFFGQPVLSLPLPIFPAAHDEPPQAIGSPAPMCELAEAKSDSAFDHSTAYYMNTGFLMDEFGEGALQYIWPTLEWAFDTVASVLADWETSPPTTIEMSDFQDTMAAKIYAAYSTGTPMTIVKNETPEKFELRLYPNPFNSSLKIEIPTGVNIAIYDVSGRLIAQPEAFDNFAKWQPASNTPSGVYYIECSTQNLSITRKAVYLK